MNSSITTILGGSGQEGFDAVVQAVRTHYPKCAFAVVNRDAPVEGPESAPEGSAVLLRTSGSTGGPKFVAISARALESSAAATETALGGPGRWVTCLPTDHIAGFQTVARSIRAGHSPIFAGRGRPAELAEVAANGIEGRLYVSLVPTQLRRLLASPHVASARRFDAILVGGAATDPGLVAAARDAGLAVHTTYGMTETCGGCVYDGAPIGDTVVTTRDGRLHISGSCCAIGYVGGSPFGGGFLTNDVGRVRGGVVTVLGRADDAITTGGETVMPAPIEHALAQAGGGDAIVVGVPDAEWGQAVFAVTRTPLDEAAARSKLAAELGRAWAPRRILSVADLGLAELPTLPSGKISRRAVEARVTEWLQRGADRGEAKD